MYIKPNELRTVQWEPTSYCNANCIGCPRTDQETMLTRPHIVEFQRHASESETQAFISSVTDPRIKNLNRIIYNGDIGDAMMHPSIDKIITSVDQQRPEVRQTLHTNGGGPWASKFEKIGNYVSQQNPNANIFLVFSIDGLENTNHLYRRNVQWKHILKNAEILRKHKVQVRWRMNKFKHNEHQIDTARQIAKDWGWDFSLNGGTWGHDKVSDLLNQPSDTKLYKEKLKNWKNFEFEQSEFDYHAKPTQSYTDTCFWKKDKEIQVVSDMTVWPCCWTAHHHYQYWMNDERIWNKEKINLSNKFRVSKNLKDIKQWQEIMSIDQNKKYLDNTDIKITCDHLLYDVLTSNTFKHIDDNLKTNEMFNLDVCAETCRVCSN